MLIIKVGKGFLSLWFSQEKSALQVNYPQQKTLESFHFAFASSWNALNQKKASKFDFQILSWFQDENAKRQEFLCVRTRFCWQTTFWSLLHFQSSFRLFLVAVSSVSELLQSCLNGFVSWITRGSGFEKIMKRDKKCLKCHQTICY